jgi:GNAT superfamily N-acetyltransferase
MIRQMRAADIPAAMRLCAAAGWNQTVHDWKNLLAIEPEGCWVSEEDGQVAATTTAVCYGGELAWIGMVLVLPEYRRRGLARGLMEHALGWLEARHVRQVKLDSTDLGRPLYESLGFHTARAIERWGARWEASRPSEDTLPEVVLPAGDIAAWDREAFGVDRARLVARLLETFPGQGIWRAGEGFLLGRPGTNAYFLGPFTAAGPEPAAGLARNMLAQAGPGVFYWDLFPDVPAAADLARELGFAPRRSLARMALRRVETPPAGRPERVYGAAGFEYG